jgi:hypothetical protein
VRTYSTAVTCWNASKMLIFEETDSYRYLDEIPETIRMYVKFDAEQMARDMEV